MQTAQQTTEQTGGLRWQETPLFRDLNPKALAEISDRMRPIVYRAGELIFQEGAPSLGLFVVLSGQVYYSKQCGELQRRRILKILGPGDIAGEEALFSPEIVSCPGQARALTDTSVAFLEKSKVTHLLLRYPKFGRHLCELLSRELRIFECKLVEQSYQTLQKNLLRVLFTLKQRFGVPEPDGGIRVQVNLSRQDWADLVGAHLDTVVHELGKLREQELIRFKDHQIVVLSETRLAELLEQETTCMREKLY